MQSPAQLSATVDEIIAELEHLDATEAACRERRQLLLERAAATPTNKREISAMFGVSVRQLEYARKRAGIVTRTKSGAARGKLPEHPRAGSQAERIVNTFIAGTVGVKAVMAVTGSTRQLVEQTHARWKRYIDLRRLERMRAARSA